jgi:c(7)-type cytochrome triheme protein
MRNQKLAASALLVAGAALAGLQKMPGKYIFPRGGGSPGPVSFNHATHVDEDEPNCASCHPTRFSLLESGKAAGLEVITHEAMDHGQACGACHGKTAFGFSGKCSMCHN